jgi:hypothetical protein
VRWLVLDITGARTNAAFYKKRIRVLGDREHSQGVKIRDFRMDQDDRRPWLRPVGRD